MARSPSHRFGQIIGEILESAIAPSLEALAKELDLYLDTKGPRAARGGKRKVVWVDGKGNTHDLDFVLEYGGSAEVIGAPRAFVEIAWRRYTKHSRNKAQEIQGAIIPLAERHADSRPALGVVLAGDFTEGAIAQLRSHGFRVLYIPCEGVVRAFEAGGIDAAFVQETPDAELGRWVRRYERLSRKGQQRIVNALRDLHSREISEFVSSLRTALTRRVAAIFVLPLSGVEMRFASAADALEFLASYDEINPATGFVRYEVWARYSNGDEIRGQFAEKLAARDFLLGVR
ncbi:DNA methylase [Candidatus Poribacteria bacterium]|nr:DNA methylase [Candidatus Poribacteria bacterium]